LSPRVLAVAALAALLLLAGCRLAQTPDGGRAAQPEVAVDIVGSLPEGLDLDAAMAELAVPSVSVALIENGEIAWTRAWGTDVNVTTPFQAASMTKPVTAAGALVLVDRGVMTLDDDVGTWIERWKVDAQEPVNLRGLLSMTAGINVPGYIGYAPGAPLPTLRQILAGQPPANSPPIAIVAPPGSTFAYSGGGYEIVEAAMQAATGVDFSELLRIEVLAPAAMAGSALEQPPGDTLQVIDAGEPLPGGWRVLPERAAGGLWATPADLARFLLALHASWHGEGGLLAPETVRELATRQNGGPYGLGFAVAGEGRSLALHKRGQNVGYQGYMVLFPETGQGAVVMTGSDNGNTLAAAVLLRLGEAYGWPWDGTLAD
jgi:CubicO group peptidase (beta-lactamase class C family)